MATSTLESNAAPVSAPDNVSSQTPPAKPAESAANAPAVPPVQPQSSLSAFGAALERAGVPDPKDGDVKPDDKNKAPDPKPKPTEKKPEPKPEPKPESKTGDKPDEPAKLDSKSLLKKDDPKPKDGDKTKPKDGASGEEPLSEAELKEELDNPHKREKSQRRYRQLWDNWKTVEGELATTKKEIETRDAKLAKLEAQIKEAGDKAGIPEHVQKELEELAMLRRERELKDDPQVKQLFDTRISTSEDVITTILKREDLPEEILKQIKAEGGFISYSEKHRDVAEEIFKNLPLIEAKKIEAAMTEQMILARQKEGYIAGEKAKATTYFKEKADREAAEIAARPDPKKQAEQMQHELNSWKDAVKKDPSMADIFGEKEIPADASETVKKQITEQNKFARQLAAKLDANVAVKTPEDWKEIVLTSALAYKFHADAKELRARVAELEAEIDSMRDAGKTTTRNGGNIVPPTPKTEDTSKPVPFGEAFDQALEKLGGSTEG